MSGLSLAVGPRTDPNSGDTGRSSSSTVGQIGGMMGSLRVIELQLVAFIMVFSASGLVPLLDLVFPVFSTLYILALSRFAFPLRLHHHHHHSNYYHPSELFHVSRLFQIYVVVGTIIGLFLPLSYVLGGFARGSTDDHAVRLATPHLFLLSCQILTENVVSGFGLFSPPVRAMVPLLYTVRRIFVIVDWVIDVWSTNKLIKLPANYADYKDVAWVWFGRALATANLLYFSVNLFGFLIPRFLPRAFERYLKEIREEVAAKTAEEDKRLSQDQIKKSS